MATTISDRFGNTTPAGSIITSPLVGTSTSTAAVALGSVTLGVQDGRAWKAGTRLRISSTDVSKIMEGEVASYGGANSVTVDVDYIEGSGSTNSWGLTVAGVRGITGSSGSSGTTGSSGANGLDADVMAAIVFL